MQNCDCCVKLSPELKYRLLLTSLGVPTSNPTKCYEDNESVTHTVPSHRIAPRLRHARMSVFFLHHEHGNKTFEAKQVLPRVNFISMGTKPELGSSLTRSSSIAMSYLHVNALSKEYHNSLCSIAPISCCKNFQRKK